MLSLIRNFLAANGNGYDNSRLSDDIHRGSRQIHDKGLRFTCPHVHNHEMDLEWKPLSNLYKIFSHLYYMK